MSFTDRTWLIEQREVAAVMSELSAAAADGQLLGPAGKAKCRTEFRALAARLDALLASLQSDASAAQSLSDKELRRRRDLVLNMRARADELSGQVTEMQRADDRARAEAAAPLAAASAGRGGKWGEQRTDEPAANANTDSLDNASLLRMQQLAMQDQDRGLDVLSGAIGKLKNVGIAISTELDQQNRMLEDMEAHVDATTARVVRESGNVSRLTARQRNGCTLCVLLLVIALLVALGLLISAKKRK